MVKGQLKKILIENKSKTTKANQQLINIEDKVKKVEPTDIPEKTPVLMQTSDD